MPKEGLDGMGQSQLILCQLDFPAGKMVSYSKFKECHLALSSLKRNIADFLGKLKIDDLSRHYFLNNGLWFHHMIMTNSTMLLTLATKNPYHALH